MSTHLVLCAAVLPLKPTEKLALLCLAENANQADYLAFPGHEALMKWTGLKKSYLSEVMAHLIEVKLIEQVQRGRRGTAATYLLFPFGCCEAHGKDLADLPWYLDDEAPATPDAEPLVEGPATPDAPPLPEGPVTPGADSACGQSAVPGAIGEKGSGDRQERVRSHAHQQGPVSPDPHQELPQTSIHPGLRTSDHSPAATVELPQQQVAVVA